MQIYNNVSIDDNIIIMMITITTFMLIQIVKKWAIREYQQLRLSIGIVEISFYEIRSPTCK